MACGPSASRLPPAATLIDMLRNKIAKVLKLSPAQGKQHHPASPWKFSLARRVLEEAGDPDLEVARCLRDGTPVGIAEPIVPSGLLPLVTEFPGCQSQTCSSRFSGHTTTPASMPSKHRRLHRHRRRLHMPCWLISSTRDTHWSSPPAAPPQPGLAQTRSRHRSETLSSSRQTDRISTGLYNS